MKIRWTEDLSSGIEEIDLQHKELIKRVNSLLEASRKGKGKDEVGDFLLFLKEYVSEHFSTEEKLMLSVNYPDYHAHKNEHSMFINDYSDIEKEYSINGVSSYFLIQIQKRMCKWLVEHLLKADKKLFAFIGTKNN
jgi:hemerythrin